MSFRLIVGDALESLASLPAGSVRCCVTSPPYFGLRDYGVPGQLGLEAAPAEYVAAMVNVFSEVRRVLADDGTLWLNLGDSYANDAKWGGRTGGKHAAGLHGEAPLVRAKRSTGLKAKDLIGIPWRAAFALQADGWWLRQDIIWAKPNPMPESVRDRCTKSHEYLFLLSKAAHYYYDADAIAEPFAQASVERLRQDVASQAGSYRVPGKTNGPMKTVGSVEAGHNKRSVWTIPTQPFTDAHFATFPPKLVEPCILAGSEPGDTILDPFAGAGTTLLVAERLGRESIGIELNPEYAEIARRRVVADAPLLAREANE